MSLKKVEQVKADKGFRIWDLIIYGAIIATVVVLFIVFLTTTDSSPLTGVSISVKGECVFEYEFGSAPKIYSDTVKVKEDNNGITVTISSADGDINEVYINKSARTAKMISANCRGGQCLYFPELNNNSGYIICDPHGLKIEPLVIDYDSPDIKI